MPLFIRNRLLFIHIPKCGGDTVSHFLQEQGDPPFLFVADGSVMVNQHTPQHLTWKELLRLGWSSMSDFRVAALVRHPIDRVVSEFRYIHRFRADLLELALDPSSFLDVFLSSDPAAVKRFDNHNLPILAFLEDEDGKIDPLIDLRPVQEMDQLMKALGLPPVPLPTRKNVTGRIAGQQDTPVFLPQDIERIVTYYARDIRWFESRFPTIHSELSA